MGGTSLRPRVRAGAFAMCGIGVGRAVRRCTTGVRAAGVGRAVRSRSPSLRHHVQAAEFGGEKRRGGCSRRH